MANNQNSSTTEEPKDFVTVENSEYKIWWDEKEGILRGQIIGDQDEESAKRILEKSDKLTASLNGRGIKVVNSLYDMSRAGTASSKARKIFAESFKKSTSSKTALFGGGVVQRTIAKFIFTFSGVKNMRYFDTEDEALRWLKE